MSTYWSTELSPWPFRSQNSSLTADGQPSENASLDCGETVTAMTVEWLTGVRVYPDTINDQMFWEGHTGPTDASHVRNFLSQFCSTPTTILNPVGLTGDGSLTNLIWSYTVKGQPLIALKQFSGTVNTLHWVSVIGIDPSVIVWADPWDATRRTASYADFGALFRNSLIGIDRARDANL